MKKLLLIVASFYGGMKFDEYLTYNLQDGKLRFIKWLYMLLTGGNFDEDYIPARELYGPKPKRVDYRSYNNLRRKTNG